MKPYYQQGGITIYHGDCLELLHAVPETDCIVTDPPYGIDYGRAGGFSASHGWGPWRQNVTWDQDRPSPKIFEAILAREVDTIIWGGNYFTDLLPPTMGWLIWNKMQRDFSLADAEMAWTSRNKATRIFDYSRGEAVRDGKQHPTQKPLALMKWCFKHLPEAKSVLDPFMGSGTTLRAAKDLGLQAIGIELEEKYCEIAAKRMQQEVFNFDSAQ